MQSTQQTKKSPKTTPLKTDTLTRTYTDQYIFLIYILRNSGFLGIGICQEVSLDSLEHAGGPLFAGLDFLFADLGVALGGIDAPVLADGSSLGGGHDLDVVRDRLDNTRKAIAFDHAVTVCEVLLVDGIHSLLRALIRAACISRVAHIFVRSITYTTFSLNNN